MELQWYIIHQNRISQQKIYKVNIMGREYVMKKLETRLEKHVDSLLHRYPRLKIAQYDIIEAYLIT